MRLSKHDETAVLSSAVHWMREPKIVRFNGYWVVVGKDIDTPQTWTALALHEVEQGDDGQARAWWSGSAVCKRTRTQAIQVATE